MKRAFFIALALVSQMALAQNQAAMQQGADFAKGLAPTSNSQAINPAGVNAGAWGSNANITPSVPSNMGAFSAPTVDSATFDEAKSFGLSGLGNSAMDRCASYKPTGDPVKDQECAAVNFLSQRCLSPNNGQKKILGNTGVAQTVTGDCVGSYGEGQRNFDFANQITSDDPVFQAIKAAQSNSAANSDQLCTEKTVVVQPATTELNSCSKTTNTNEYTCSQTLSATLTTTKAVANTSETCPQGVQVGSYCQYNSVGTAKVDFVCPVGYSKDPSDSSGKTCTLTSSVKASPNYSCPVGSTPTGPNNSQCLSANNVVAPAQVIGYSCSDGGKLDINTNLCVTQSTVAAVIASYTCNGVSQSGSTCNTTTTSTSAAASSINCATGSLNAANQCVAKSSYDATKSYLCPQGYVVTNLSPVVCSQVLHQAVSTTTTCVAPTTGPNANGYCAVRGGPRVIAGQTGWIGYPGCTPGNPWCMTVFFWPWQVQSCPNGWSPVNGECQTTVTTIGSIGYSCSNNDPLSGSTCTSTTTTAANISYNCPTGSQLNSDHTCTKITTTTSPATPNFACTTGYAPSQNNTCTKTIQSNATPSYSCPAGSTPTGPNNSQCITTSNVVTPADILSYSCPNGSPPQGAMCYTTVTEPARVQYSCPADSIQSPDGKSCTSTVSVPVTINYSCSDGSSPINGLCTYKSMTTAWNNACGAFETSAGIKLGTP